MLFILWAQLKLPGQNIEINANNDPLNEVLMALAREYGIQLSFDDQLLSTYPVTLIQSFPQPEEAIAFIIRDLPLEYQQIGEVYTIYPKATEVEQKKYLLSGRVLDSKTLEVLPYSHILVNESGVVSDFNGNFSCV